jgi:anti-anti-sigma regulatory factor
MTAPVYQPPPRVDGNNVESFRRTVIQSATRYGHVVIDCSQVVEMGPSALRVLAVAARGADVVLVNPNQAIRLMAAAYEVRVAMSDERERDRSNA